MAGGYLYGTVGTGKTLAACGAIRAYVERHIVEVEGEEVYWGKRAMFVNAPEWFSMLRETMGSRNASEMELFRRYANCGLLVLDDLGTGKLTDWTTDRLYMLINKRWSNEQMPTIITSNCDLDELCRIMPSSDPHMSEKMHSRIGGLCKPYKFEGPDMRVAGS